MLQNLNLSLLSYFSAYYMHHLTQTDTVPIYHITDLQYIVTDSYHLQHIPFLSNTIFTTFFIQKNILLHSILQVCTQWAHTSTQT